LQATNYRLLQPSVLKEAVGYVLKIKNRFGDRSDVYVKFLDILYAFQKDREAAARERINVNRAAAASKGKYLTESEVYAQVIECPVSSLWPMYLEQSLHSFNALHFVVVDDRHLSSSRRSRSCSRATTTSWPSSPSSSPTPRPVPPRRRRRAPGTVFVVVVL
jgi:hypothetical protein